MFIFDKDLTKNQLEENIKTFDKKIFDNKTIFKFFSFSGDYSKISIQNKPTYQNLKNYCFGYYWNNGILNRKIWKGIYVFDLEGEICWNISLNIAKKYFIGKNGTKLISLNKIQIDRNIIKYVFASSIIEDVAKSQNGVCFDCKENFSDSIELHHKYIPQCFKTLNCLWEVSSVNLNLYKLPFFLINSPQPFSLK